ncbi:SDR family NAD(P)-dependent oxidoreductase [Virgisporangium aurantiacum]|uniref:Acyl-CoA synthetase (AMP-forming)/AMP-acid ligase II n=1 Tax=Virgisporangium aurantiacum TaxID=175570 RepID=A0A8J3Z7F1_9ACTN|nr:SDR family NAD(P)-dependent oxidoreductase [Virgisporangium aurantiacum]GIJ56616.1 hypothetical protein Vau01_041320 [Virgisporangium aurantiacum]
MKRLLRVAAGIAGRGPDETRLRRAVGGRIVLVTGASEGIGAATARRLAAAGATVLLVARTVERLDAVRADIVAAGGAAHVHPADLSDPDAAAALATAVLRRYRRVDVVVSNAGRSIRRSVADTADRFHDVTRTAALNYLGPVRLLLALLPAMRAVGGGHVVNVSTAGLASPAPNWSSYLASKAAFDTWLRCVAPELRRDGVTVSTVYCGLTRTRMSAPTLHYSRMPAMSPDEAAAVVCRAVADRPRGLWPWWARAGAVVDAAVPGPVERLMAAGLRAADATEPVRVLTPTGVLRPDRVVRAIVAGRRHGSTLLAAFSAGSGAGTALVDAIGPVTRRVLTNLIRDAVSGAFHRLAVRPGDRVAVCCAGHRGFVAVTAALTHLGADAVLIPPDLPADRWPELIARERLTAVVTDAPARTTLDACAAAGVPALSWTDVIEPGAGPVGVRAAPGRLVVLSSGSTGTPTGVTRTLPLRGLLGPVVTHLRHVPLRTGEPIVVAAPPHHGYGLTYLAAGLALGCPVVLAAGLPADRVLAAAARYRAVALFALPVQLRRLAAVPDPPALPALRAVVSGAAPLTTDVYTALRDRFGERVHNLYGSTEAGWAAIATPADLRAAPGTVGRAPRGVTLRVVDRRGVPLPPGAVGEVQVAGWRPPDGSAGSRWQRTGDLGRLDLAGRLFLAGRVDDMIVSGGENVYPGPVLAALAAHPDVAEAVVTAVDDAEFGQRFAAWVEPVPGRAPTPSDLVAWLRPRLSRAERPRDVHVVDHLPRTATGKPRSQ